MRNLAIIPARGGSKGLPGKSLLKVGGLSLVARAIKAAQESECFEEVAVSSDWGEVLAEAGKYGATPIIRPTALARDESPVIDAILHVLGTYGNSGIKFDTICLLNPTSPLRNAEDIRACYAAHEKGSPDTTVSVVEVHTIRMTENLGGIGWRPETTEQNRQAKAKQYIQNGAIYIANVPWLKGAYPAMVSQNSNISLMPKERSVDVDTQADLELAEALCGRQKEIAPVKS